MVMRIILLGIATLIVAGVIGTAVTVWSGHIPEKYDYNPELPAASSVLAWTKINSSVVQNAMKKTILEKSRELETYEAPKGFNVMKYSVPVDGGTVKLYAIEPENLMGQKDVPVVLYIHGGAFYFPLTADAINSMAYYAKSLQARVFMPDYRTSMDNPFPVPLQDCYASALYLKNNAEELGLDPKRMIIYGDSAGGCLAAGIIQYIRDYGGPEVCGQMLIYPVLDSSMKYESMRKYKDAAWPLNANENMWDVYLKNGDYGQLKYAAPLQSDNFGNLPQAYIEPSEMDILCDEGIAYAVKLQEAGIDVEISVIPGSYHGFDSDQSNSFVRKMLEKRVETINRMIGE
jgi:acetyl esterase/lipase